MRAFIVFALFAAASASKISGGIDSAVTLTGPSGVVGRPGIGLGYAGGLGLGLEGGLGYGGLGYGGLGYGGLGYGGLGYGGLGKGIIAPQVILSAPVATAVVAPAPAIISAPIAAPLIAPAGAAAITNGGGLITASGKGATLTGPPTAPVIVKGPSGKIVADGLWGPTSNIGLGGGYGYGKY